MLTPTPLDYIKTGSKANLYVRHYRRCEIRRYIGINEQYYGQYFVMIRPQRSDKAYIQSDGSQKPMCAGPGQKTSGWFKTCDAAMAAIDLSIKGKEK